MYRILISKDVEEKAQTFSKTLFSERRADFVKPSQALIDFYDKIEVIEQGISEVEKKDVLKNFKEYIKNLAMIFERIVDLHPREYDWYQEHFFSMVKKKQFSYRCRYGEKKDSFYMLIVEDCLRYSCARDEFISFVEDSNIQSCVYCNMHSLESCSGSSGNFATYQLDHFKDKRDFPFLGINFYNMVPSCSYCNQKKSKNEVPFFLYRLNESEMENPFKFIFPKGFSAYFTEQKRENINYEFDVSTWYSYQHESVFEIQSRYEARLDEIEDFLKNLLMFVPECMDLYKKSFPQLPYDAILQERINRLLKDKLNYSQVHEFSYTKIRLDLAQELNLIPRQTNVCSSSNTCDLLYKYFCANGFVKKIRKRK